MLALQPWVGWKPLLGLEQRQEQEQVLEQQELEMHRILNGERRP